ncbi:MAG: DUF554 domain-containing protein [Deltaproteobacteria bacterium]|nr:DUF554 domain-containing protein [Deltaproteobacteria bacterium]
MIIPWGAIINAAAVAAGAVIGLFFGNLAPERTRNLVFQLFGLCLVGIALNMVLSGGSFITVILSCALGAGTGELLKLSERLDSLGGILKRAVKSKNPEFTEGLVNSSLLVCVGAMSIIGSFEEGLGEGRTTVFTKSVIDFFAVMILASRSGSGVVFSAIAVLFYQGGLTMLAAFLKPWVTLETQAALTGAGGVLVLGIAMNMIGIPKPVNLKNSVPALLWALILPSLLPF